MKKNVTVNYDRHQFRQYLQESGAVAALSKVLMQLYELKENRPSNATQFIRENLPHEVIHADYAILQNELDEIKAVLEKFKASGNLTRSQLNMIENLRKYKKGTLNDTKSKKGASELISARESQIKSKTSTLNGSEIRKMSGDTEKIKKAINKYLQMSQRDCNSLLKKYLTMEMYEQHETVTTALGSTLFDCISSGLEIPESMVGVYAADYEAYDTFTDLFDPLIKDYHNGFERKATHPDLNWGDPNVFTDLDPNKKFITSTRIRCIRTVKGFPLVPKMTEEDFIQLCHKIKDVVDTLAGDVKGTWYGLENLAADTRRDLINNRYILEFGDRYLEAAGATQHWPSGRAVFINDTKTFFIWVNEEDHLRFISMGEGSDIAEIYKRLIGAVTVCSSGLEFARHPNLGFVSLCPTNLGNTIRASVMIKLPELAKQRTELDEIVKQHNLEIRGCDANSEMFEISNKRKLGLDEHRLIHEFHDGISEIIKKEESF